MGREKGKWRDNRKEITAMNALQKTQYAYIIYNQSGIATPKPK